MIHSSRYGRTVHFSGEARGGDADTEAGDLRCDAVSEIKRAGGGVSRVLLCIGVGEADLDGEDESSKADCDAPIGTGDTEGFRPGDGEGSRTALQQVGRKKNEHQSKKKQLRQKAFSNLVVMARTISEASMARFLRINCCPAAEAWPNCNICSTVVTGGLISGADGENCRCGGTGIELELCASAASAALRL